MDSMKRSRCIAIEKKRRRKKRWSRKVALFIPRKYRQAWKSKSCQILHQKQIKGSR